MADEVCLLFAEEVKEILKLGMLHSAGSSSAVTPLCVYCIFALFCIERTHKVS